MQLYKHNPIFPGWRVDKDHKLMAWWTALSVLATCGGMAWRIVILDEEVAALEDALALHKSNLSAQALEDLYQELEAELEEELTHD